MPEIREWVIHVKMETRLSSSDSVDRVVEEALTRMAGAYLQTGVRIIDVSVTDAKEMV